MTERRAIILSTADARAHDRGNNVTVIPLITRHVGSTGFMNGITVFRPDAAVPLHFHNCDESVLVLAGQGIAEIDGVEHCVACGEMSFIPAGVHHRFRNASAIEPMRICWTYASIDADRTIVATGETRRIDAEHGDPNTDRGH